MYVRRHGAALAAALVLSLPFVAPASLVAQDPGLQQRAVVAAPDEKIDPQLLLDGEQIASNGFVRELDRARTNLRVVIEIVRQRGDVTFETSTARDPLPEVQAATIQRQALFLQTLEGAFDARTRAGINVLFPLDLQYMVAAEIADVATLRAVASLVDVKYVWKDNLNRMLTNEGRIVTGSTTAATNSHSGIASAR